MKHRSLKSLALAAGLCATLSVASAQTTLTYSSWLPWTHPVNTALYIPWMEAIEKDSGGRIQFKRLPKPVAAPTAHLNAVRTGQADVAFSVHGYSPKEFAAYMFIEQPLMGDTAVSTSIALQRVHETLLADKGFYKGVRMIGMNTHGPGHFHHSGRHLTSPADMAGQKIRTGGPIPQGIVEAWGGVAIRQPAPKTYEILSTGVADGVTFPFESLESFNLISLVPYTTTFPGGLYSSSHYLVMNEKKYEALSPEDKAVIDKHSGVAFAERAGKAWDMINDKGLAAAKAAGNKIAPAPEALVAEVRKLEAKFEAEYIANAKEVGVDGQAVLAQFRAEMAKQAGK